MTDVLRARHPVDVGVGRLIEPGEAIPDNANPQAVERLRTRGLIATTKSKRASKSSATTKESS